MRPSKRKFMLKDEPGNSLAPVFGAYRQRLSDGKYAPKVQALYLATVFHFGDWIKTEGVALGQVRDRHIRQFLADHMPSCECDRHTRGDTHTNRAALHLLGRVMEGTGFAITRTLTPMDAELSRFDAKMREVWGYSESTRAARCRIIKRFLIATVGAQAIDINCISESDVSRFIIGDGTRSTSCARGLSGAIRCFLRYRQLIGDDVTPLLAGLPRPPRPKLSTLPDVLTDVEVDALLQSFSADFPQRRRAFAIARCLIDLGMRSSEVAGLTLEDIDWQRGTIRVTHRKGRRADILPLLEATGKAIADYILHERPAPACLNVFVRHRPPIGEPIGRRAVQTTMLAAYRRLGWDRTRVHILRHTLATRLLARGTPMPVIADVMGHRSLATTVIYTKLDSAWLSKVSLAWPGGAQ